MPNPMTIPTSELQNNERYLFKLKPESGFENPIYAIVHGIVDEHTTMFFLKNIKDKVTHEKTAMFSCPEYWIISATPAPLHSEAGRKKRSLKTRNSKRRMRKSKRLRRR